MQTGRVCRDEAAGAGRRQRRRGGGGSERRRRDVAGGRTRTRTRTRALRCWLMSGCTPTDPGPMLLPLNLPLGRVIRAPSRKHFSLHPVVPCCPVFAAHTSRSGSTAFAESLTLPSKVPVSVTPEPTVSPPRPRRPLLLTVFSSSPASTPAPTATATVPPRPPSRPATDHDPNDPAPSLLYRPDIYHSSPARPTSPRPSHGTHALRRSDRGL